MNRYVFRCLGTSGLFALAGLLLLTALVACGSESAPPSSPQQETATIAPSTTQAVATPEQSTAASANEPVSGQLSDPTPEPETTISATTIPPTPSLASTAPLTPTAQGNDTTPPPAIQTTSPPAPAPAPQPSLEQEIALQLSQFLPWIEDPPDPAHDLAAATIINLGIRFPELGNELVSRPWLTDGVTSYELMTIKFLEGMANADPALAWQVSLTPWVADSLQPSEMEAADALAKIARADHAVATGLVELPWLADGLSKREASLLGVYERLAKIRPDLASALADKLWLKDGVSEHEAEVVEDVMDIAAADLDLALEIVNLPWLRYDATHDDLQTVYALSGLASSDVHLTRILVGMPEIADADFVTSLVWNDLYSLSRVASRDSDLVWEILATSPNPLSVRNRLLFRALFFLMSDRSGAFRELEQQPWFADGLNDEEAAFLAVTRDLLRNAPDEYYEMLTSRYAKSRTVNLPLAGEVSIWAIQKEPFPPGEDITASIAETIMAFEEFLGVPFQRTSSWRSYP